MFLRLRTLLVLLILSTLGLSGCSSNRTLVGTWETSMTLMGKSISATQTFAQSGSFRSETLATNPLDGGELKVVATGTYKMVGDEQIEIDVAEIHIDGITGEVRRSFQRRLEEEMKRDRKYVIQWVHDDKIALIPTIGQALQLVRKK